MSPRPSDDHTIVKWLPSSDDTEQVSPSVATRDAVPVLIDCCVS